MSLPDAWPSLKCLTPARVAVGRTGASLSTGPVLDFQLADAGRLAGRASGGSDVMTEAARCQLSGVVLKEEANGRIPG